MKRRTVAATVCVALLVALVPVLAMADLLPPPLPGELPLHRIGYEIVFEALAASAFGAAALRALLKRRWKLRGEVTAAEKEELQRKLQVALPRLRKFELEAKDLQSDGSCGFRYDSYYAARFKKELENQLMDYPELRRALDGVPIEWVYDALVPKGWSEEDSPWMTKEDAREMEDSQRERCQSSSMHLGRTIEKSGEGHPQAEGVMTIEGRKWAYRLVDGTAIINHVSSAREDMQFLSGEVAIPPVLGECPVVGLGRRVFWFCQQASVKIPARMTSVANDAFFFCDVDSFSVAPDNPEFCALNGMLCSKDGRTLIHGVNGDVKIPSGVVRIGDAAFEGCKRLTSVAIPSTVTHIGAGAFLGCDVLTTLAIPAGVVDIGEGTFAGCSGLTSVSIPRSAKTIGADAFHGCPIKTVYVENGDEARVRGLYRGWEKTVKEEVVPHGKRSAWGAWKPPRRVESEIQVVER